MVDDFASRLAVNLVWREHVEPSGPLMDRVDVVDRGEGQRLRPWCRCQPALGYVDNGDDDAVAVEVVAGTRMAGAVDGEKWLYRWVAVSRSLTSSVTR